MTFNESGPWKAEVGRCARVLKSCIEKRHRPEEIEQADEWGEIEETFLIEKHILLGCIAVRRLLEMKTKVSSDLLKDKKIPVKRFPLQEGKRPPDQFAALSPFDRYNLEFSHDVHFSAQALCNLFIHSHIQWLHWAFEDADFQTSLQMVSPDYETTEPIQSNGSIHLRGVFATTDFKRKHLYWVDLKWLIECFEEVSVDDVTHLHMQRNEYGDWEVISAVNVYAQQRKEARDDTQIGD